jgi:hypothetical protein
MLYFIKKSSLINLFEISESNVPNRIIFENSPKFQLDPPEKQLMLFEKKLFRKILNPPHPNPQSSDDYRTVTIKCMQQGYK